MSPGRRSTLFASLGGFVLCSSLYTFLYFSVARRSGEAGFLYSAFFFSSTQSSPPATVMAEEEEEELACTPQQGSYQASHYCSIFMGRHNLKPFFTLLRFHLPDAKLLVDIGANKGLVSSRWLELWRPELNQTAREHVNFVKQYVKEHAPAGTTDRWCGVTNMCDKPNLVERTMLEQYAPVTKHKQTSRRHRRHDNNNNNNVVAETLSEQEPFELYSFEPSPHLYQMQQHYITSTTLASDALRAVWKWLPYAASDEVKEVYFDAKWNEGSRIEAAGGGTAAAAGAMMMNRNNATTRTRTRTVTLDSLAEHSSTAGKVLEREQHPAADTNPPPPPPPKIFGNRTIDIMKIDAEGVDAAVLVGASRLLRDERIRVVMWETPNVYPLHFPDWFGGIAKSFGELLDRLDQHAHMSCYIPGTGSKMIKLTKCWDGYLSTARSCKNTKTIHQSNAICVSRTRASALYRTLEANALIYQAPPASSDS
jgi:Methyltransferase FkbM domain